MATITYGETAVVDRAGRVEEAGVAYIPDAERDSRPANLAAVFFGANLAFSVIVFGWLPITFGLGWWPTVTASAHRPRGLRRDALARLLHVPARRVRPHRSVALRPDRPARVLAGRRGVRLAAGPRDRLALHAPRTRPRHPRGRGRRDRAGGSRPGVP